MKAAGRRCPDLLLQQVTIAECWKALKEMKPRRSLSTSKVKIEPLDEEHGMEHFHACMQ